MHGFQRWSGVALAAALVAGLSAGPRAQTLAQAPAPKKILFLAGPKDHGAPGRHEHEKDLRILAARKFDLARDDAHPWRHRGRAARAYARPFHR